MPRRRWYLLIHQVPQRPLYLRAKVRARLSRAGAVALKRAVYALPRRPDLLPRLREIAAEVASGGGEAYVCEADLVGRGVKEALVATFRRIRQADYEALAARLRQWAGRLRVLRGAAPLGPALRARLTTAKARLEEIRRIDFFDARGRGEAEAALAELALRLEARRPQAGTKAGHRKGDLIGRTWVTRRGVLVDRIASAWFVRRFLDPRARFRFIDPLAEEVRPGEIRFDMPGGEFTHEDDRCTLETLIARTAVRDPALARVAEIVHDIDIKDGKFGRPESRGVERLLVGLLRANPEDEARLARGFALMDDLYRSFAREGRASSTRPGGAAGKRVRP